MAAMGIVNCATGSTGLMNVTGTLGGGGWRDDDACLAYAGVPVTFATNVFQIVRKAGKRKTVGCVPLWPPGVG